MSGTTNLLLLLLASYFIFQLNRSFPFLDRSSGLKGVFCWMIDTLSKVLYNHLSYPVGRGPKPFGARGGT